MENGVNVLNLKNGEKLFEITYKDEDNKKSDVFYTDCFISHFNDCSTSEQCKFLIDIENKKTQRFFDYEFLIKRTLNRLLAAALDTAETLDFDVVRIKDKYYLEIDRSFFIKQMNICFLFSERCFNRVGDKYLIGIETTFLIRSLIEEFTEIYSKSRKSKKSKEQKTYIMLDSNTGLYKIGKSKYPRHREKTLQSEKPTIELVLICDENVEHKLHKEFSNKRVRGEWFKLSSDDILDIIEFYKFYKKDTI